MKPIQEETLLRDSAKLADRAIQGDLMALGAALHRREARLAKAHQMREASRR